MDRTAAKTMAQVRGSYNARETILLPASYGSARVIVPMCGVDDCYANAVYNFTGQILGDGRWEWKLHYLDEWLPPMSPQEKSERFTDEARLPPIFPGGAIDFAEWARRRNKEWAQHDMEQSA